MDWRLRECNYGDMNGYNKNQIEEMKFVSILKPYPNGESYSDCLKRMEQFLTDLKQKYDGQSILIIGHRATQYGLECICLGKTLEDVVMAPWLWQEEWNYKL